MSDDVIIGWVDMGKTDSLMRRLTALVQLEGEAAKDRLSMGLDELATFHLGRQSGVQSAVDLAGMIFNGAQEKP